MLAHHPVTGQPIHILRTETQIATDHKTLLWHKASFLPSPRWQRWHSVITEPSMYRTEVVAVVIGFESNLEEWASVLPTILSSDSLVVCPVQIAQTLETAYGFSCPRTLLYEDLAESYPYIGEPLKADASHEQVIVTIAHILRMNRIRSIRVVTRCHSLFECNSMHG